MTSIITARRMRSAARGLVLVAAGGLLAGGLALGDLWFDGGRVVSAALGRDAIADVCAASLVQRLSEKGFEPADVELGPAPHVDPLWGRARRFGDSFTFVDGAAQSRVDGVMACDVSGPDVRVDFRVGSAPHRAA